MLIEFIWARIELYISPNCALNNPSFLLILNTTFIEYLVPYASGCITGWFAI